MPYLLFLKKWQNLILSLATNCRLTLTLILCMLGNFAYFFVICYFFSKNILSGEKSECQTVWIQIRPDILSDLICVQNICKYKQQTTKVVKFKQDMISIIRSLSCHARSWFLSPLALQETRTLHTMWRYRDQIAEIYKL